MGRASLSRGATQFSRGSIYKKSPSSCKGREHPRYHPNCLPAVFDLLYRAYPEDSSSSAPKWKDNHAPAAHTGRCLSGRESLSLLHHRSSYDWIIDLEAFTVKPSGDTKRRGCPPVLYTPWVKVYNVFTVTRGNGITYACVRNAG